MSKILLVIDMQNDFVDAALGTREAVAIVPAVCEEIKKDYDIVICTRDTHHKDYLETNEGKHLPVVHCVENTDGWQLNEDVRKVMNERGSYEIIDKPTFGSEELVSVLKRFDEKEPIDSITLIGLCTDICVVTNALLVKTAFPEIPVIVKADCCAGVTPESHEAALKTMQMCQIEIV